MSRFHDDRTIASHPGGIRLSPERFRQLESTAIGLPNEWKRGFESWERFEEFLDEHLQLGDSDPALVISIEPLLVAAYSCELDCIVMLKFPSWLARQYDLEIGSRLLSVNTYVNGTCVAPDLLPGPWRYTNDNVIRYLFSLVFPAVQGRPRYVNFYPIIAEFFSADDRQIAARKTTMPLWRWGRCEHFANEYLRSFPGRSRNGSPYWSAMPVVS
jgi:hypothetical protein